MMHNKYGRLCDVYRYLKIKDDRDSFTDEVILSILNKADAHSLRDAGYTITGGSLPIYRYPTDFKDQLLEPHVEFENLSVSCMAKLDRSYLAYYDWGFREIKKYESLEDVFPPGESSRLIIEQIRSDKRAMDAMREAGILKFGGCYGDEMDNEENYK